MKELSIAVLGDYFLNWMGGANFIGAMARSLTEAANSQSTSVYLLIDAHHLPEHARDGFEVFHIIPRGQLAGTGTMGCLLSHLPEDTSVVFYKDVNRTVSDLRINAIAPTGLNLGRNFPVPWLAYIPDFQHQYLTNLFSQEERVQRDQTFRLLAENSHAIYVNSITVARDVERFYGNATANKRVLIFPPVLPVLMPPNQDFILEVQNKYRISQPYLISCSQRWMHKNHEMIIFAIHEYLKKNPDRPVSLVFTGDKTDYRNNDYSSSIDRMISELGLSSSIHDLGLIDRNEQLALISGAIGVVSASLFEGGPGSSGVLEAALLGIPSATSNLDVNREMPIGKIHLFEPTNPRSLTNVIERLFNARLSTTHPPLAAQDIALLNIASGIRMISFIRSIVD
jgi:glycosyltransferase involved in cell wall biosynthesis